MDKIRVGIIFGGRSGEHEISLMSATSVINAMDKEKYSLSFFGITKTGRWMSYRGPVENIESGKWEETAEDYNMGDLKKDVDFALPVLHGPYGEDGTIQGLFEMLDIPYAGCGVLASALAMDKAVAKEIFARAGLPVCKHVLLYREDLEDEEGQLSQKAVEKQAQDAMKELKYPVFVKPANMGSSVGISKARDDESLAKAIMEAAKYDRRILVEEGINAREVETGVIGNHHPEAAEVGEILPSAEFYDYHAKYFDGGESKLCIPAPLSQEKREEIRDIAVRAYMALDCAGFSRVDFFIDKDTDKVYINEINTIPGFTKFSMFPLLWQAAGVPYGKLIERIIGFGYEKYKAKNKR